MSFELPLLEVRPELSDSDQSLPPTSRSRWFQLLRRGGQIASSLILGLGIIVTLTWLTLHWGILPRIQHWKGDIEVWSSRAIGTPVTIGTIEVTGGLWAPVLHLRDVAVIPGPDAHPGPVRAAGAPGLRLASVEAVIDPRTLLPQSLGEWRPSLRQVVVKQARLDVQRDASGQLWVAGMAADAREDSAQPDAPGKAGLEWLLSQRDVQLRDCTITWTDALDLNQPIEWQAVSLQLLRNGRKHRLQASATPPASLGLPVSATGEFTHPLLALVGLERGGDWETWSGTLDIDLPRVDAPSTARQIAAWQRAGVTLAQGSVQVKARLRLDAGRWVDGEADLALRDVQGQFSEPHEPFSLKQLSTQVSWNSRHTNKADDWVDTFRVKDLQFETGDAEVWPRTQGEARMSRRASADWHAGDVQVSQVDLEQLSRLARHLPLAGPLRRLIEETQPSGWLKDLQYRWDGALEQPDHYAYAGQAFDLRLAAAALPEPSAHAASDPHAVEPVRPGVERAHVVFKGDARGGSAQLDMRDGALDLPGVFAESRVPVQSLAAALNWRIERPPGAKPGAPQPTVSVTLERARFRNPDAAGDIQGRWQTGAAGPRAGSNQAARQSSSDYLPGVLDLHVRIAEAQAQRVHRYLPVQLPESVRTYVRQAVQGGTLHDIDARVRGHIRDFPFHDKQLGVFKLSAGVRNGRFAYMPAQTDAASATPAATQTVAAADWPALSEVNATLVFDRTHLRVRDATATVDSIGEGRFALSQIEAQIADFSHDAVVQVSGNGHGPVADVLTYLRRSPVDGWLDHVFAAAEAKGQASVQLKLQLPLTAGAHVPAGEQVQGSLALEGTELLMAPDVPRLTELRGELRFSDAGFQLDGLQGQSLGGAVILQGGMPNNGRVRLTAQGRVTAEGLRNNRELPWLAHLGAQLNGQTDYTLALAFPDGQPDLQVTSQLQGLAALWPAPLGKAAGDSVPLKVMVGPSARHGATTDLSATGGRSSPAAPSRTAGSAAGNLVPNDWIRVETAAVRERPAIVALYEREPGNATQPDRTLRGAVQIGSTSLVLPAQGVQATIDAPTLAFDAWQQWLDRGGQAWIDAAVGGTPPPRAVATGISPSLASSDSSDLAPTRIRLRSAQVTAANRLLNDVELELNQKTVSVVSAAGSSHWTGQIKAREMAGSFDWQSTALGDPMLTARLSRLSLPDSLSVAPSVLAPGATPAQPRRLPGLDITAEAFELNGLALGKLSVQAVNRGRSDPSGPAGWLLRSLSLTLPEAELTAQGRWGPGALSRTDAGGSGSIGSTRGLATQLDFKLALHDSGALLQRLGHAGLVRGGQGEVTGQLGWLGAPTGFDLASLNGQFKLSVARGRFLRADPGAARLLGVLSLQSLPRRLLFDFSDVTQEGFSFDAMTGDVTVRQGMANTQNLRIQGVQASIVSQGRADLAGETQDLHVWVVPDLNAGAASLAYAIVNPAVGLGTLLGQLLFRDSMSEASTREFKVSGHWTDPKVTELPRQHAVPTFNAASGAPLAPAAAAGAAAPTDTAPLAR